MAGPASLFGNAVAAFREAVSHVEAARAEIAARAGNTTSAAEAAAQQRSLAEHLRQMAAGLTPGWLGLQFDTYAMQRPLGTDAQLGKPVIMRLGEAVPLPDARFPAISFQAAVESARAYMSVLG